MAASVCVHSYFICAGVEEETNARSHFEQFKEVVSFFNIELRLKLTHIEAEEHGFFVEYPGYGRSPRIYV